MKTTSSSKPSWNVPPAQRSVFSPLQSKWLPVVVPILPAPYPARFFCPFRYPQLALWATFLPVLSALLLRFLLWLLHVWISWLQFDRVPAVLVWLDPLHNWKEKHAIWSNTHPRASYSLRACRLVRRLPVTRPMLKQRPRAKCESSKKTAWRAILHLCRSWVDHGWENKTYLASLFARSSFAIPSKMAAASKLPSCFNLRCSRLSFASSSCRFLSLLKRASCSRRDFKSASFSSSNWD